MSWVKATVLLQVEMYVTRCDACGVQADTLPTQVSNYLDLMKWGEALNSKNYDAPPSGWAGVRADVGDPVSGPKGIDGRHLCGKCWSARLRRFEVAK